jgi:hypothetical protein
MKLERNSSTAGKKWHEERRSTVRVPVDHVVAYSTNGHPPIIARVSELSNTSFCMLAGEVIPVGMSVTIAFPSGALLSKDALPRIHVFGGRVVHACVHGAQYRYAIDLFENPDNVDDLRWTILQLSLRRTARGHKTRTNTPLLGIAPPRTDAR